MEFGWLIIVLGFALFFGCGRACGWGSHRLERGRTNREGDRLTGRSSGRRPRLRDRHAEGPDRSEQGTNGGDARAGERVRTRSRRTSPLQELQRKFVEGRITLDEYERQIDGLERLD